MSGDPLAGLVFRHVHTPWLVGSARTFAQRCRADGAQQGFPDTQSGIAAILFAAIGVEAFFNELPSETEALARRDPILARLREALIQAEEDRAQIMLKFIVACIATGRGVDRGAEPFQGLDLLFDLRNAIAHVRSYEHTFVDGGRVDPQPRRLLTRLFSRGLITDPTREPVGMFMATVSTPDAAEWSVATAQAAIDYVIDGLTDAHSQELCFFHFSPLRFQRLPEARGNPE